ncbi:hypothetical protein Desaci_2995 [Desulfosporosinus acidiphilus SJ4]|uniref:Uncharacterized protein n=1 Tax=Desulfosporosinus acidiphilus (strain DSM 22704 / JCM 16185 / SJ4) TaxID=646529 RepID=I4D7Y0_DESAJ|nr:hypothetical protein Desaci_2995 [Desulfosporosinus acidiphilus SJ4]
MTKKEQLMINAILESIGLESIKTDQTERPLHQKG